MPRGLLEEQSLKPRIGKGEYISNMTEHNINCKVFLTKRKKGLMFYGHGFHFGLL